VPDKAATNDTVKMVLGKEKTIKRKNISKKCSEKECDVAQQRDLATLGGGNGTHGNVSGSSQTHASGTQPFTQVSRVPGWYNGFERPDIPISDEERRDLQAWFRELELEAEHEEVESEESFNDYSINIESSSVAPDSSDTAPIFMNLFGSFTVFTRPSDAHKIVSEWENRRYSLNNTFAIAIAMAVNTYRDHVSITNSLLMGSGTKLQVFFTACTPAASGPASSLMGMKIKNALEDLLRNTHLKILIEKVVASCQKHSDDPGHHPSKKCSENERDVTVSSHIKDMATLEGGNGTHGHVSGSSQKLEAELDEVESEED